MERWDRMGRLQLHETANDAGKLPAPCISRLDGWCNSAAADCAVRHSARVALVAALSFGTSSNEWRCCHPSAVDTHRRYRPTSVMGMFMQYLTGAHVYCARDIELRRLLLLEEVCRAEPDDSAQPSPPSGVKQFHGAHVALLQICLLACLASVCWVRATGREGRRRRVEAQRLRFPPAAPRRRPQVRPPAQRSPRKDIQTTR